MGYFITIIAMGQMGWLTTVISVILGIVYRLVDTGGETSPFINATVSG